MWSIFMVLSYDTPNGTLARGSMFIGGLLGVSMGYLVPTVVSRGYSDVLGRFALGASGRRSVSRVSCSTSFHFLFFGLVDWPGKRDFAPHGSTPLPPTSCFSHGQSFAGPLCASDRHVKHVCGQYAFILLGPSYASNVLGSCLGVIVMASSLFRNMSSTVTWFGCLVVGVSVIRPTWMLY